MKQLFITDLDGTLLTPQGVVSKQSAEIISALSAQGVAITVATARTPATVQTLLADTHTTVPAIVMTGAALWDRNLQQYISPKFFTLPMAISAWQSMLSNGLRPFVYTLDSDNSTIHTYFCGTPTPLEQKFIGERSGSPLKKIHVSATPVPPDSRTMLLFAIGSEKAVLNSADTLRKQGYAVSAYPDTYTTDTFLIEVFAPGVSKAAAVKQLKEMTHADKVYVFGDNLNDIPMMQVADTAVAMANALPQVKQNAHIVIGDNASDSVARYIQHHATLSHN